MGDETQDSFDPLAPLRDPGLWPEFLSQAFERAVDDAETARASMVALLKITQAVDSATWRAAWDTQFFSQLAHIIASGYCCGYTRDQLTSSLGQDPDIMGTIICSIEIFTTAIVRDEKTGGSHWARLQLQIVLDIIQDDFPRLWDNLWEIREPFLVSEAACAPGGPGYGPSLHASLSHLAVLSSMELENQRGIAMNLDTSRTPHLALLFWIYNRGPELRAISASRVSTALEGRPWNDFYRSVAHGCTGKGKITAAFLRDLKSEDIIGQHLYSTITLILMLRHRLPKMPLLLETPEELQLVPWTLGAARRELCRGDSSAVWHGDVMYTTFAVLKAIYVLPDNEAEIPHLSARQTYGLLALMARYVVPLMEGEDSDAGADYLTGLTARCRTLLRRRSTPEASAELRALARHTHSAWKASADEISRRRLGPRFPAWRHFLILWRALGDVLRYHPEDDDASPVFGALERCGWEGCLCSVHKPAHSLRVCKGCWVVAYCGAQCQKSDWVSGGHREKCRQ